MPRHRIKRKQTDVCSSACRRVLPRNYNLFLSLFQVLLSSALVGAEYEDVTVDPGRAILPDTTVAPGGEFLYVLSTAKVGIFWKIFQNNFGLTFAVRTKQIFLSHFTLCLLT